MAADFDLFHELPQPAWDVFHGAFIGRLLRLVGGMRQF